MEKELLSYDDVMDYFKGWPDVLVKKMLENPDFPRVKINNKWFFSRSLIDNWIRIIIRQHDGNAIGIEDLERREPNIRIIGKNED